MFTESHAAQMQKLERELEHQRARTRHVEDQFEGAQASARAYKGHNTRIKNRIKNGVCPFCNRSFADVRAHMASKHANPKERNE
jgi:hypothetical protein